MSTKKIIKKVIAKKKPVAPKVKAVKKPKFKLVSYTLKAVIPTGQYANIQPEITVQAKSIEAAERAVMPYIETMFAKYRDGGVQPIVSRPAVAISPAPANAPASPAYSKPTPSAPVAPKPVAPVATAPVAPNPAPTAPVAPTEPAIVLTVPFNRAKSAIESCMSKDALKLVSDQIEKSVKLIDTEKVELKKLVTAKFGTLK